MEPLIIKVTGKPIDLNDIAAALVYGALYLWTGRNLWARQIIAHGVYDTVAILLAYVGKYPGL